MVRRYESTDCEKLKSTCAEWLCVLASIEYGGCGLEKEDVKER
jgi:hypothetical protein